MGENEYYETEKNNFDDVKDYIQNWVEGWLDTANENNSKITITIQKNWKRASVRIDDDLMKLFVEEVK